MFVCYQDGKRCKDYGYESWENDSFEVFEDAVWYCMKWAYPIKCRPSNLLEMEISIPIDMSTSEFPVRIGIREE